MACMHAWIDRQHHQGGGGETLAGVTIDAALRALLDQFRLPGEAQKWVWVFMGRGSTTGKGGGGSLWWMRHYGG